MLLPEEEERALGEVVLAARKVQEFLWGEADKGFDWEEWKRMFRKRVARLDEVDDGRRAFELACPLPVRPGVPLDVLHPAIDPRRAARQDDHLPIEREQRGNQRPSQKPGAAGDDDPS